MYGDAITSSRPCPRRLRERITKKASATIKSTATPRPAPSPAARPIFGRLELEAPEFADEEEAEAPDAIVLAGLVLIDAVLVIVLSLTNAEVLNPEVVATNPGHDVLPMTVTVVGCDAPNFIAFRPVSQLQSGSPGQQYQSPPPGCEHFRSGMDVLLSIRKKSGWLIEGGI